LKLHLIGSHSYVKLDLKGNEDDKMLFEAALAWDLEVDGKNVSCFSFFGLFDSKRDL
jgi:hypothetical protein